MILFCLSMNVLMSSLLIGTWETHRTKILKHRVAVSPRHGGSGGLLFGIIKFQVRVGLRIAKAVIIICARYIYLKEIILAAFFYK